jgi:hypothetical protein
MIHQCYCYCLLHPDSNPCLKLRVDVIHQLVGATAAADCCIQSPTLVYSCGLILGTLT